jgi:hypothetical protein
MQSRRCKARREFAVMEKNLDNPGANREDSGSKFPNLIN